MTEAIITALITGGLSLIGVVITVAVSNKGLLARLDKQSELSDEKIRGEIKVLRTELTDLRADVSRHNSIVERTYDLEKRMGVAEERQKTANHRIDDLEKSCARG